MKTIEIDMKEIKKRISSLMETRKGEVLSVSFLVILASLVYREILQYNYTGPDFFAQIAGNSDITRALASPLSSEFLGENVEFYSYPDVYKWFFPVRTNVSVSGNGFPIGRSNQTVVIEKYNASNYLLLCSAKESRVSVSVVAIKDVI